MLRSNPPHHTRQRRLAAGVFTARRVAALRATIAGQVDELLASLALLLVAGFETTPT
jgi:cytochrome P450